MNQLWRYGFASTENDRKLALRIVTMVDNWDAYAYSDVLQSYRDFDFLLKRCFLGMVKKMSVTSAYSILHNTWVKYTSKMLSHFEKYNLFPSVSDSSRLKHLIELAFFNSKHLVKGPNAVANVLISPVISIVMPVYHAQQYLWEALRSIYEQSFQDFELILVNEYGNDDPLEDILSVFGDYGRRTIIVQKTTKARLGASLNMGIKQAKGEFIARMDADDIALPERFAKQVNYFRKHSDIDLCGTQFLPFGTSNNWIYKPLPHEHPELQCRSLKYCSFLHPTVMWRRATFIENGLWYNEEVLAEDTDLFARVVFSLKTSNLTETLLLYRREQSNLSTQNLRVTNHNNQSLAVIQSMELEQRNLSLLFDTLTLNELGLLQSTGKEAFSYKDALSIYRYRLGREDLSDLLPPDTSVTDSIFTSNIGTRIPVIWGYGWNGMTLEYILQKKGYAHYKIVDQRMQELQVSFSSAHSMKIEALKDKSDEYYVLLSMDKHFMEVTDRLLQYGYKKNRDYIEYYV